MIPTHLTRPLLTLTLLAAALLSTGCGILAGPYFIPKVLIDNHVQHFDLDIVDAAGKPVPDATVTLVKKGEMFDAVNGTRPAEKREILHSTAATLSIDRAFYTEIDATIEKPGFAPATFTFHDGKFDGNITRTNTDGTPHGTVTLSPASGASGG